MSSIVTDVISAAIGLLVNKGRDVVAERLREGDVADEAIRKWIVREITEVSSRLNGLARKDLKTSITHFSSGFVNLSEALNKANSGDDCSVSTQTTMETATDVNIPEILSQWKATDLDESGRRMLSYAKEDFKEAGKKATEAFSNEDLEMSHRIQAMLICVAARILENVDHPRDALAVCRLCLHELHSMPAVKNNFKVALDNRFWARLQRNKRKQIISNVCRINRVIYDVMQIVCEAVDLEKHCVVIGKETLVDIHCET